MKIHKKKSKTKEEAQKGRDVRIHPSSAMEFSISAANSDFMDWEMKESNTSKEVYIDLEESGSWSSVGKQQNSSSESWRSNDDFSGSREDALVKDASDEDRWQSDYDEE